MKRFFKTDIFNRLTTISFVLLRLSVSAQELTVKESPSLEYTYLKKSDGAKLMTATLTVFRNRITYPIAGSNIDFYLGTDTVTTVVKTNADGKAYLLLQPGFALPTDKEGLTQCTVKFGGNDTLETAESSISFKDAVLKMSLHFIDSIKNVTVWAFESAKAQDSIPLAGETVKLYVSRMFSLLNIGEGSLDDQGQIIFEFPADLPGEADGTLQIIARIEDHEQFGNIETVQSRPWGVPSMHGPTGSHRALWTAIAPKWMIVTLTIMLTGVWGHYIYVLVQLVLIKRESKKLKF